MSEYYYNRFLRRPEAEESQRMDWKALFEYSPSTHCVRVLGGSSGRLFYGQEVFRRRANYLRWLNSVKAP